MRIAESGMKILFALRSPKHLPYVESIIKSLDCEHEILYDKDLIGNSPWNFDRCRLLKKRKKFKFVSVLRELKSYISYTKRDQSEYYLKRWNSYLPKWLGKLTILKPVRFALSHSPEFNFERFIPPDQGIIEHLKQINPDVVFATPMNMRFSAEVEYAKAAKHLGIPVVSVVFSWDNLTTKGLFHIEPDILFAWNERQKRDAIEIHGIPKENIQISGSPFFDKWFDNRVLKPRSEFCLKVGLDPDEPYFLYLGSSKNIAEDEGWVIELVAETAGTQILIKPHPFYATWKNYKKFEEKYSVLYSSLEDEWDLYNAIIHSEYTVGINTSAMIDAVILGKPCMAIISEKYKKTQLEADHFKVLMQSGVIELYSIEARRYFKCSTLSECPRERFIKQFIRPNGHAGKFIVEKICRLKPKKIR